MCDGRDSRLWKCCHRFCSKNLLREVTTQLITAMTFIEISKCFKTWFKCYCPLSEICELFKFQPFVCHFLGKVFLFHWFVFNCFLKSQAVSTALYCLAWNVWWFSSGPHIRMSRKTLEVPRLAPLPSLRRLTWSLVYQYSTPHNPCRWFVSLFESVVCVASKPSTARSRNDTRVWSIGGMKVLSWFLSPAFFCLIIVV